MRTDQTGLTQLRGYQAEMARPQVRAAERGEQARGADKAPADTDPESTASTPRDLGKGRLLDIYG